MRPQIILTMSLKFLHTTPLFSRSFSLLSRNWKRRLTLQLLKEPSIRSKWGISALMPSTNLGMMMIKKRMQGGRLARKRMEKEAEVGAKAVGEALKLWWILKVSEKMRLQGQFWKQLRRKRRRGKRKRNALNLTRHSYQ